MSTTDANEGKRAWLQLGCGTLLYFLVLFQRTAVPGPVFELLQTELNVSSSSIPLLGAFFMYSYAGMQLIAGLLVDRYGWSRFLRCGALLFCVGALMFPLVRSLPLLYVARALTGAGAGTIYLCLVKEAMVFPRRMYGMLIGGIVTVGFGGGVLANSLFPLWASRYAAMPVLAAIGGVTLLLYFLWNLTAWGQNVPRGTAGAWSLRPFADVLKRGTNWAIVLFNTINFALFYVILTVIGKKFLSDFFPSQDKFPALVFTVVSVLQAASGLGLAALCRCLGNRPVALCRGAAVSAFILYVVSVLLIGFGGGSPWCFGVIFCILSVTCAMTPVTIPVLREVNGDAYQGTATSILNFGNFFFVALLGNLAGVLIRCFSADEAAGQPYGTGVYLIFFSALAVLSLIPLVASFCIRMPKDVRKAA